MKEWVPIVLVIMGTLSLLAGVTMAVSLADKHQCQAKWADFKPKWSFWSGCMVSNGAFYVPVEAYREVINGK